MKYILLILFLFLMFFEKASAQIFRYRIAATSSFFITEIGNTEINNNLDNIEYPGSEVFKPEMKMGAEVEFLMPVKDKVEFGIEFEYNQLAGKTETAPLYNFFLTRHNPLPDTYRYPNETLIYSTKILSVLATYRYYLLPLDEETSFFMKASGGVSFIGTDFTFSNPIYRVEYNVGVLYSRGTRNSEYPKKAAFNGGIGVGVIFELSDIISIYADANSGFIYSDIMNGVPNYDYIQKPEKVMLEKANSWAIMAQLNIGMVFTEIPVKRLIRNNDRRMRKIFR